MTQELAGSLYGAISSSSSHHNADLEAVLHLGRHSPFFSYSSRLSSYGLGEACYSQDTGLKKVWQLTVTWIWRVMARLHIDQAIYDDFAYKGIRGQWTVTGVLGVGL